jgi:glycosyltransferase involved in cell wall biosynthesis
LIVAGGAGSTIQRDPRFSTVAGLHPAYVDAGVVSEDCLSGLLETAHVVIAPINVAQGASPKTAEALWSGRHVVASTAAMRGFEAFIDAEGVVVADEPVAFRRAIREALIKPPLRLSQAERTRRRLVLWDQTLAPLVDRLEQWREAKP